MGEKATSCQDCFERSVSVSTCRLTHGHCGRGVPTSYEAIGQELDVPQCVSSDLQSVTVSHSENCLTGYFDYLVSSPDHTPSDMLGRGSG